MRVLEEEGKRAEVPLFSYLDSDFASKHTSNLCGRPTVTGLHVGRLLGDNEGDGAGLYGRCAIFLYSPPPPH